MYHRLYRLFFVLFVHLLFLKDAFAAELTMANISEKLIFGTSVVTRILMVACFILGLGMILYAIVQYRFHRQNPKFVPLDRPILFAILGAFLLVLPFFENLGIKTGSALQITQETSQIPKQVYTFDIDAPIINSR